MRAFLFHQDGGSEWVELNKNNSWLQDLYRFLDCRCIDLVCLEDDEFHSIDLVVDGEFLLTGKKLNESWKESFRSGLCNVCLCGSVIMVRHNEGGEIVDLTDSDLQRMVDTYKCVVKE